MQAQGKFDECEKLRSEREELRNLVRPGFLQDNDFIMQQQQKAMEVRKLVCKRNSIFLFRPNTNIRLAENPNIRPNT